MFKLLILSSNPRRDLNLNREISDLNNAIRRLDNVEVILGLEACAQDLPDLLAEHNPQFVHFCGHGTGKAGLVFQDEDGLEQLLSTEVLAHIFNVFANDIHCVVLNACNSNYQAEAIVEHINYVIGMNQSVLDEAAQLFSVGFYKGLATGKSIEQAYEMGRIAIQIWCESRQKTLPYQHRDVECADEDGQPATPLQEYMKPILLKKQTHFISHPTQEKTKLSDQAKNLDDLEEFVEYLHQEIDRKEYKAQARASYESFGQNLAQGEVALTKVDYQQRRILLDKVRKFWIEGFLKPSLQDFPIIRLSLQERPDAIADQEGIEALSVELDASYEKLRKTCVYRELGQGKTLLILGKPGSGKTIALLQLAQRLIHRSEDDLSLPIPVVFNLTSWARHRKPIVDWLIDELQEKYHVPKFLSEPWILQQQLILLLDGLDEVSAEYRNECVIGLNKFLYLFPQTQVAICSRIKEYEALTEHLQISSALCLQPLSSEQMYQALDSIGGSLTGLKMLLKSDLQIRKLAKTPLMLNFMSVAYQGWMIEDLKTHLCSTPNPCQHILDTYVSRRLERGAVSDYSKDQVLHWLSWLANQMLQKKRAIFLVDKIQPSWLQNQSEERSFRIKLFIVGCLILGSLGTLISFPVFVRAYVLTERLVESRFFILAGSLIGGISGGLIGGLITALPKEISTVEKLSWSWRRAKFKFFHELLSGILNGLIFGLVSELAFWRIDPGGGMFKGLSLGLFLGIMGGLILGFVGGLGNSKIDRQTVSNHGIFSSLKNCLLVGLVLWPIVALIFLPIVGPIFLCTFDSTALFIIGFNCKPILGLGDRLLFGLTAGFIGGLISGLKYGGAAFIQHLTLRHTLYQKGCIPWNYTKFLNFASNRLLMKRVGGGYIFFHRILLEHFAQMKSHTKSD